MSELIPYHQPDYNNLPPSFPPECASSWGEDGYGIWFELVVNDITQRFRWVPRGNFTMGSPEDERERETGLVSQGKETLREVAFGDGFWLADTACTQALWGSVMSNNPSSFKDDTQNPVETVSWLDAQKFITTINQLIPNLKAHLPTEAQWEYACRAGTTSPFSFGENITPQLVNYHGDYPYADGEKGEYRERTVPVKALPANHWGLYQMHGNVWEWCFDEFQENLGSESVTNPVTASFKADASAISSSASTAVAETDSGKQYNLSVYDSALLDNAEDGGVERVLRGGSWLYDGRYCRSAIRDRYDASDRTGSGGFRFAVGL